MTNLPIVKLLSPDNCGCSQVACNIVNFTFMSLDGFAAMRRQMDDTSYPALAFAAELARVTDREIMMWSDIDKANKRAQAEKEAAEKAAEDEIYRESTQINAWRQWDNVDGGYGGPHGNYHSY